MTINWTVAAAFISFACLHSLTVSDAFKRLVSRMLGERWMRAYYRMVFTAFSAVITGVAVYIIFTQPDLLVYRPPLYISIPARIVQVAGAFIFLAALKFTNIGSFIGVNQAKNYLQTGMTSGDIEGMESGALITSGVYGLVRHPMYLAGILVFLFEPVITENNLTLRILASCYFIFGMFMEERRLLKAYGEAYKAYRSKVPRFIPRMPTGRCP